MCIYIYNVRISVISYGIEGYDDFFAALCVVAAAAELCVVSLLQWCIVNDSILYIYTRIYPYPYTILI